MLWTRYKARPASTRDIASETDYNQHENTTIFGPPQGRAPNRTDRYGSNVNSTTLVAHSIYVCYQFRTDSSHFTSEDWEAVYSDGGDTLTSELVYQGRPSFAVTKTPSGLGFNISQNPIEFHFVAAQTAGSRTSRTQTLTFDVHSTIGSSKSSRKPMEAKDRLNSPPSDGSPVPFTVQ